MIIGPRFRLHRFPIKDASKQKTRIQTDTKRWGIYRRRPFLNTYNEIVPLNRRRITPGSIYIGSFMYTRQSVKRIPPPPVDRPSCHRSTISFLLTSDFLRLIGRLIYIIERRWYSLTSDSWSFYLAKKFDFFLPAHTYDASLN